MRYGSLVPKVTKSSTAHRCRLHRDAAPKRAILCLSRSVKPRNQPLSRRLLVAGCAIDLPGKEQP